MLPSELRVLLEQDSAVPAPSWLCLSSSTGLGTRTAQMAEICLLPARGGSKKAAAGRVGCSGINSVREFLDLVLQPGLEAVLKFRTARAGKSAVLLGLEWSLKC